MSASFRYGVISRFYGLFSQLPWSLVVTAIVLLPVAYYAEPSTRYLIIELTIYWALAIGLLLFARDLYMQRFLLEFSVRGRGIVIHKGENTIAEYKWEQLRTIRKFTKKDRLSRKTLEGEGLLLKFEDGFELPVFEQVSNYDQFNSILKKVAA